MEILIKNGRNKYEQKYAYYKRGNLAFRSFNI